MVSLALSGAWLMRLPADADYLTDLLPAFLLAGVAVGLASVSVQISAFSGVSESAAGLASGLVETMREIGGAVGVATAATAIASGVGATGQLSAFHSAFGVICTFAVLGAVLSAVGFRPQRDHVPVHHELDVSVAAKPAA
jgi:hypothetical protein